MENVGGSDEQQHRTVDISYGSNGDDDADMDFQSASNNPFAILNDVTRYGGWSHRFTVVL